MVPFDGITPEIEKELIEFTQNLIRIKSFSGQEEQIVRFIEQKMKVLGYDEVTINSMGNLLGRIGGGGKTILFDAHMDTVEVNDAALWQAPPFSGDIINGRLYGRGSVDMKSAVAAAIYAGAIANDKGLVSGKTVYISCSVFEEDCDGEGLKHLLKELNLKPDYVVICEPSSNTISLGHKGKAQISIKTRGVSAHGSAPEKGVNAIYEMAEIIQRIEKANSEMMEKESPRGSLVVSRITSTSAWLNAVPSECEIYLDRRMVPGETEEAIRKEMEQFIQGKNATWQVGTLQRKSWTGAGITYVPFHLAWKIDLDHELTQKCRAAYTR